jgi:hypothetical protein
MWFEGVKDFYHDFSCSLTNQRWYLQCKIRPPFLRRDKIQIITRSASWSKCIDWQSLGTVYSKKIQQNPIKEITFNSRFNWEQQSSLIYIERRMFRDTQYIKDSSDLIAIWPCSWLIANRLSSYNSLEMMSRICFIIFSCIRTFSKR